MKTLIQVSILFSVIFAFAQQSFIENVVNPLQANQLLFEKVFIHTNKTAYLSGENVWFKAYVSNSNNKPSLKTTHLIVNLIDAKGTIVQTKDILINNGIGKGQFSIDDSFTHSNYYIQAYTNYMRNFSDRIIFIKKISILNNSIKKTLIKTDQYDIQLFPEGGYLLENTENNIGIKALINGNSYNYTGKIINSKNKEIAHFNSSYLGMTKCSFFYRSKETYKAVFQINDTLITIKIPKAKDSGVMHSINVTDNKLLRVSLKAFNISESDTYALLFHQGNKLIEFLEISRKDSLNMTHAFDKNNFFNGVNTATLFKNNQPITERKFYIEKEELKIALSVEKIKIENDSVNYKLTIKNKNSKLTSKISISIVPVNTPNYSEKTTIESAYLLSPYVKGYIENPSYYFNTKNPDRKKHMELLLLTQGWTQYSLSEMITQLNPIYKFDFELGFGLKGTVHPLYTNHLALINTNDLLIDKIYLNSTTNFKFKELLIYKNDTLKISFINSLNEAIKPKTIYYDTIRKRTYPKFKIPAISEVKIKEDDIHHSVYSSYNSSHSIKLQEVVLNTRKQSLESIYKKQLVEKYKPLTIDIGLYYPAEISDYYKNENIDLMTFLNFDKGIKLENWKNSENYLRYGIDREALLFINGKKITSSELPAVSLTMDVIENIMYQPFKGNLLCQVFTKKNYKKGISNLYSTYIFNHGYDKAKKYYVPQYDFNSRKNINEIDWKPDIQTNKQGETFFKFKRIAEINEYMLYIQGFTDDGLLINKQLIVH